VETTRHQKLRRVLTDPLRKPLYRIAVECMQLYVSHKTLPRHYFTSFLYRRSISNYKDFVTLKESRMLHNSKELHSEVTIEILQNKLLFQYFCYAHGINTPKFLGFLVNGCCYDSTGKIISDSTDRITDAIAELVDRSETGSIFVKPISGIGGENCFRLDYLAQSKSQLSRLENVLANKNFIVQEALEQHEAFAQLHPASLNTIRIETYIGDYGPTVLNAFLRVGQGGSAVDNGSSGGCFVGVELSTGKLNKYAFQLFDYGGEVYEEHPDTGVRFEGYELPFFDEAKSLVIDASTKLGDRLVGWDVGVTPTGPVLIEGNHNYYVRMSDIAYGGLRKHNEYRRVLEKYARQ
jgi:hypothetical protein